MSEKLEFQIYYGEGEIIQGVHGVDLSGFASVNRWVSRANERTISGVHDWLMRIFGLDRNQHNVKVMGIVSRVREGTFWELVPLNATSTWRKYVNKAVERGWPLVLLAQAYTKEVHEVHGVEEEGGPSLDHDNDNEEDNEEGDHHLSSSVPTGQADEGEHIEHIVEEMAMEDMENENISETDSSEDENEIPVPLEWKSNSFKNLMINEGNSVPWEYHDNELVEGGMYKDKDEVMSAVKYWSLSMKRSFAVVKSNRKVYDVKCVFSDCPFRVHAYEQKWSTIWKCSIVTEHTCELEELEKSNTALTSSFIAEYMYNRIVDNLRYEPKSIVTTIEEDFKYTISYSKAWRAKQKVIEKRFGSYEASYDNLPRLLETIRQRNIGTYYDIMDVPDPKEPGKLILRRAFFALGQCIMAFRHCRPILCMDGTFLTGKYKGQILTAIGVDGNNQVVPVAFAFVESENRDSWYWFLERVKLAVVQGRPNVCVIHDRHAGLLKAIMDMQFGSVERDVPCRWPDIQSRWCMRHLGANFFSHFRNKHLMNMFKRLCNQNQQRKFNAMWTRLDELTTKQTEELATRTNQDSNDMSVPLSGLPTDALRNVVRRSGSSIRCFSDWIEYEPKEKWSLLYDTDGARFGIMTTNLAEVYNWVIRGMRGLPLVAIVEGILHGTCKYFRERYMVASNAMTDNTLIFSTFMTNYMKKKVQKASLHRARPMGTAENRFEVLCRDRGRRGGNRERIAQECVLRYNSCSCSCMKPQLLHRPCSHVIAACSLTNLSPRPYVSYYFTKEVLMTTWNAEIYGFAIFGSFTNNPGSNYLRGPDKDKLRQKAGRRKTRRIRNDMDESEVGRLEHRCTRCNGTGHTYKNCPRSTTTEGAAEAGPSGNPQDGRRPRARRGLRNQGGNAS